MSEDPLVCDYQLEEVTYENSGTDFGPTVGHFFNQIATGCGAQGFLFSYTTMCTLSDTIYAQLTLMKRPKYIKSQLH